MKQLIDFIPLILFFSCFKLLGIYPATALLLVSTVLIYGGLWFYHKKLDQTQAITLGATLLFGSMTLIFHNDTFIKLKAPIISYLSAVLFAGSQFIGEKTLAERMMHQLFAMPASLWKQLNFLWVLYFLVVGSANLFVAFHFPAYWVSFKVFGSLGMTFLFIVLQMILFRNHIVSHEE